MMKLLLLCMLLIIILIMNVSGRLPLLLLVVSTFVFQQCLEEVLHNLSLGLLARLHFK